jgi:hypothetical protein
VNDREPILVIKASPPYGHESYTRIQHGKLQFIAPKGVRSSDDFTLQVFAQKLQKIGRLGKGKGRHVKLTQEELMTVLDSGKFALISADKSPHDDKTLSKYDVQKRHKLLKTNLISQGYAFTQVVGNYDGIEDSFLVMVHDADLGDMQTLGKALKQDSIIYGTEGKYIAYFTTGPQVGMCVRATSWQLKPSADNYYTEYSHPDGSTTKFALDLDFSKPEACETKVAAFTLPDLGKSATHERFYTTVMTLPGKVKRLGVGRFGARQAVFDNGVKATLKPKLFSNEKFRGISRDTQYRREAAAYQLDRQVLKFGIVPPTTLTVYGTVPASIQAWAMGVTAAGIVPNVFNKNIDGWKERVARLGAKVDTEGLRKLIIFDLIVNNTDRHAKNCLFDSFTKRVWAIDNGLCFGRYLRFYNNVFHRYLYRKKLVLSPEEKTLLESITLEQLMKVLQRYLPAYDIEQTYWRVQWVLKHESLGYVDVAPDSDSKNDFPSYKQWFKLRMRKEPHNRVLARLEKMGIGGVVVAKDTTAAA